MKFKKTLASLLAVTLAFGTTAAYTVGVADDTVTAAAEAAEITVGDLKYVVDGTTALVSGLANNITDVVIPSTVEDNQVTYTVIGITDADAFGDTDITSVSLPETMTEFNGDEFERCLKLQTITVAAENNAFTAVDGVLFTKDMTTLIFCPVNTSITETTYTVPATVTKLGGWAFIRNERFTTINLPAGLREIGSWCFTENKKITGITLPEGATFNGEGMPFSNCTNLGGTMIVPGGFVELPFGLFNHLKIDKAILRNGIRAIYGNVFEGCELLEEVSLPTSLRRIGVAAFAGCTALKSIEIPEGVMDIDANAFGDSDIPEFPGLRPSGLEEIWLPSTIEELSVNVFDNCGSLKTIHFAIDEDSLSSIKFYVRAGEDKVYLETSPNPEEDFTSFIMNNVFKGADGVEIIFSENVVEDTNTWVPDPTPTEPDDTSSETPDEVIDGEAEVKPGEAAVVETEAGEITVTTDEEDTALEGSKFVVETVKDVEDDLEKAIGENATEETKAALDEAEKAVEDGDAIVLDLSFMKDGAAVQPGKSVTIELSLPASLKDAVTIYVYHVSEAGIVLIAMPGVKDGSITFTANSFSPYIFSKVALKNAATEDDDTSEPDSSDTATSDDTSTTNPGSSTNPSTGIGVALIPVFAAAGAFAVAAVSKKRK